MNAVRAGSIETPMISRLTEDARFAVFFDNLKHRHPIGRFGEPAEIGEAVKWLLSGDAAFMNGAAMAVDGDDLTRCPLYRPSRTIPVNEGASPF